MKLFVIRHIPTGKFMPQRYSKSGGWSWWMPTDPNDRPYDPTPRLFLHKLNASNSLKQWLIGPQHATHDNDGMPEPVKIEGMAPRVKDEMEIVPVWLSIGGALLEAAPAGIEAIAGPATTVGEVLNQVNGGDAGVASGGEQRAAEALAGMPAAGAVSAFEATQ